MTPTNKEEMKTIYDFYGKNQLDQIDQMIVIRRYWIANWKFPFIHRKVKRMHQKVIQKKANKALNEYLDNIYIRVHH